MHCAHITKWSFFFKFKGRKRREINKMQGFEDQWVRNFTEIHTLGFTAVSDEHEICQYFDKLKSYKNCAPGAHNS